MSKPLLVILALLVAGGVFGWYSAVKNANPYSSEVHVDMTKEEREEVKLSATWEPSPAWFPSYLVATVPRWSYSPPNPINVPNIPDKYEVIGFGLIRRRAADLKEAFGRLPDDQKIKQSADGESEPLTYEEWFGQLTDEQKEKLKPKWSPYKNKNSMNFRLASAAVGGTMGLILAIILAGSLGWIQLRKSPDDKEKGEPKAAPKQYNTWP